VSERNNYLNKDLYNYAMKCDIPMYESEKFQNQYGRKELEKRLTSKETVVLRPQPVERPKLHWGVTMSKKRYNENGHEK
jgi:hypothetical protein